MKKQAVDDNEQKAVSEW